jgi:hypothetical protein
MPPVAILLVIVLGIAGSVIHRRWGERCLHRWAAAERHELLDYRRAYPWKAPSDFLPASRFATWHVTVRTANQRHPRTGLVRFYANRWIFGPVDTDVTWDIDSAIRS